jgi:RNA polymerase sigma-70 factor (ECF subfamily)
VDHDTRSAAASGTHGLELGLLLERCRMGDELAWECLVRRCQGRVYAIACCYLGAGEDARDAAQEAFVRLYRNLRRAPPAAGFMPWLIRLARNVAIDQLRRRRSRPPGQDLAVETLTLPAGEPDPEERYAAAARSRLVERALGALSALNREIILLKEIQGLKLDEIAAMLRVPLGTVKSRSNRARLDLAAKLLALGAGDRTPG